MSWENESSWQGEDMERTLDIRTVLAYTCVSLYTFQSFGALRTYVSHTDSTIAQLSYSGSSLCNIMFLLMCALLGGRLACVLKVNQTAFAAGALCSLSALSLSFVTPEDSVFPASFLFGIISSGVGTGLFSFLLAGSFQRKNPDRLVEHLMLACFFSLVTYAAFSLLSGTIVSILVVALPLGATFLLTEDANGTVFSLPERKPTLTKKLVALIVRMVVCVVAFSAVSGLAKGLYVSSMPEWGMGFSAPMLATTLVAFSLVWISSKLAHHLDAVTAYRAVFFVTICSLATLAISEGNGGLMLAVQRNAGELIMVLVIFFGLKLSMQAGFNPFLALGLSLVAYKASARIASILVGPAMDAIGLEGIGFAAPCLIAIIILAAVYLYIFSEGDVRALIETDHARTTKEANEVRCKALSKRAGLTPREEEVLVLYSQGKTARAIAEELFLSENTVSMYRRKIYTKLEVHSKQELLALLESEEEPF